MLRITRWSYKWLPIIFGCHCRDDRSFHYKGKKFPICARCTGLLAGIIAAIILYFIGHPSVGILALLLIPLIADGSLQKLTRYESNNILRAITGLLFGYAIFTLFLVSYVATVKLGYDFGLYLQNK